MMVFSQPKNVKKQSCVNRQRCCGWQKRGVMDLYGKIILIIWNLWTRKSQTRFFGDLASQQCREYQYSFFELIPSTALWVNQVMNRVDFMIFPAIDKTVDETLCVNWRNDLIPATLNEQGWHVDLCDLI
jgi:hypothetical protein